MLESRYAPYKPCSVILGLYDIAQYWYGKYCRCHIATSYRECFCKIYFCCTRGYRWLRLCICHMFFKVIEYAISTERVLLFADVLIVTRMSQKTDLTVFKSYL